MHLMDKLNVKTYVLFYGNNATFMHLNVEPLALLSSTSSSDSAAPRSFLYFDFGFVLNLPKSDYVYHFPIDFEPKRIIFISKNKLKNGRYNLISVDLTRIRS